MMEMLTIICWILFSLLFVAFFTAVEMAFISCSRIHIELKKKQGNKNASIVSGFIERPSVLFGTTLMGINTGMVIYGIFFIVLIPLIV